MGRRPGRGGDDDPPALGWLILTGVVSFTVLLGMWIALVGAFDSQDLVAGAASAAVSVGVGYVVGQRGRALPSFRRGDLGRLARLIPDTLTETAEVYVATVRRVRARHGPDGSGSGPGGSGSGGFRTVATDAAGDGWRGARRSAVVGALLSVTPNTVVIDVEPGTGVATVHDFVLRPGTSTPDEQTATAGEPA